jgi:hypothetical protein
MASPTRSPAIEQLSREQLKALVHRLTQAHSRAKDISARQRREMSGKASPRGSKPARDNAGSIVTHYCSTKKNGADFQLGRKTQRKRMKAKLREIKETLRRHRHTPIDKQGKWLGTMMKGYFAYFAVPTNTYLPAGRGGMATREYTVCKAGLKPYIELAQGPTA